MSKITPIEASLIHVIEAIQHEYDAMLEQRGLAMKPPKVSVLRPESDAYSSEVCIDIIRRDSRQLIDRLEFFAFEDGKPQLTDEELRVWLVEQIKALVKEPP